MTLVPNVDAWREIFQLLQENPALWKIKSPDYKNKMKKANAWELLLEKYREIDSEASLTTLKNKITNIRTCYRRELKKITESSKSGAADEDVYVPTLWYFNELDFLKDQEEAAESISTVDMNVEKITTKRKDPRQNFLEQACMHLESMTTSKEGVENDGEVYAKSWARSYQKLSNEQQLYAKKAIEDILILGRLNQISLNIIPSPSSAYSSRASTPYSPTPSQCVSLPAFSPVMRVQKVVPKNVTSSSASTPYSPAPPQCVSLPAFSPVMKVQQVVPKKMFVVDQQYMSAQNEHNQQSSQNLFSSQSQASCNSNVSDLLADEQYT